MEGKYGRLFTEEDVKKMLRVAVLEGAPSPEEQIAMFDARGELAFPADEPLFVLRGQDRCAEGTIHRYGELALDAEVSDGHLRGVAKAEDRFRAWQDEHPDRVKTPD